MSIVWGSLPDELNSHDHVTAGTQCIQCEQHRFDLMNLQTVTIDFYLTRDLGGGGVRRREGEGK